MQVSEDALALTRSELERITKELVSGNCDTLGNMFASRGLQTPMVQWAPTRQDLQHPFHQAFAKSLDPIIGTGGRILASDFATLDLGDLTKWIMLVEPTEHHWDFRYLRYGSEIVAVYGHDMTGKNVSEIQGFIPAFFLPVYRAAMAREDWALTTHEPPPQVFARAWRRLIVPLYDTSGQVVQIVTLNVPDNDLREGLEIVPDPVLVVEPQGRVVFANSMARTQFGNGPFASEPTDLEEYLGVKVDLTTAQKRGLFEENIASFDTVEWFGKLVVRYHISTKPITYRDRNYITVLVRIE